MAEAYSYTNNAFLAAANPLLAATGDPNWDRRFADWMIADGLAQADIEFGRFKDANYALEMATALAEDTYGRGSYRTHPKAKAIVEPTYTATLEAEEARHKAFLEPMWAAARRLTLTPAPNLTAALFKIELIKREDLWNDVDMSKQGDCFDLVAADMARLRAGRA